MPSLEHDVIVTLLTHSPECIENETLLLQAVSLSLPLRPRAAGTTLSAEPVDLPLLKPQGGVPPQPDAILVWRALQEEPHTQGKVLRTMILEVQLSWDSDKREGGRLIEYVTMARAKLRCPISLLVIPRTDQIGERIREPLVEECLTVKPCVLIPSRVQRITDESQAIAHPQMTFLALALHGIDYGAPDGGAAQLRAADAAATRLDSPVLITYLNQLARGLSPAATQVFRSMAIQSEHPSPLQQILKDEILRDVALSQLGTRFGAAFTPDMAEQVRAADTEQLDTLVKSLGDTSLTLAEALYPLQQRKKEPQRLSLNEGTVNAGDLLTK